MDKAVGNQIQRALVERLPGGERVLTLRLTPPELGTVRIEVVERQGTLLVKLGAEDDSVKASLERVLPQLRAEMRAHDAPISSIDLTDTFLSDRDSQRQHSQNGKREKSSEPDHIFDLGMQKRDDGIVIDRALWWRGQCSRCKCPSINRALLAQR